MEQCGKENATMRTIGYRSQRKVTGFENVFPDSWRCFTASAWMFLSFYDSTIEVDDDEGFNEYLDDVEASIGKAGIAEEVQAEDRGVKGHTSTYFKVQQAGINKRIAEHATYDENYPIDQLGALVQEKPVIIRTYKLGGLPGGHMVLLVDYLPQCDSFRVNDPYGNAVNGYNNPNGNNVLYQMEFIKKAIDKGNGNCIILYVE
jgi:hypothetical protein